MQWGQFNNVSYYIPQRRFNIKVFRRLSIRATTSTISESCKLTTEVCFGVLFYYNENLFENF